MKRDHDLFDGSMWRNHLLYDVVKVVQMHPGATYSVFCPCVRYDEDLVVFSVVSDQVAMNSDLFSGIQS